MTTLPEILQTIKARRIKWQSVADEAHVSVGTAHRILHGKLHGSQSARARQHREFYARLFGEAVERLVAQQDRAAKRRKGGA